jgi:hypothetical protein
VAGKTGIGPVDSEMGTGMFKTIAVSKAGVGTSIPTAASQSNNQVILVGLGEFEQRISLLVQRFTVSKTS